MKRNKKIFGILVCLLFIGASMFSIGIADPGENDPPIADSGGPYYGNVGENINFDSSGSYDPDGNIILYQWDFGDGNLGYGEITSYSYLSGGDYTVNLTVMDNLNGTDYNTTTAYVNNPPDIPIITGPMSGNVGTEYEYTFVSVNPDGDDNSYYIEWGDGEVTNWTSFLPSGVPYYENHTWTSKGTYTIRAKAVDIYGAESAWGELTVTMSRNKIVNSPLLQFLQQHPNLFLVLQKLIQQQRFGL